jgi:hypothetical protein
MKWPAARNQNRNDGTCMIPFISRYRQQWHYERDYWLTKMEKRRAFLLTRVIMACVTISVVRYGYCLTQIR